MDMLMNTEPRHWSRVMVVSRYNSWVAGGPQTQAWTLPEVITGRVGSAEPVMIYGHNRSVVADNACRIIVFLSISFSVITKLRL